MITGMTTFINLNLNIKDLQMKIYKYRMTAFLLLKKQNSISIFEQKVYINTSLD